MLWYVRHNSSDRTNLRHRETLVNVLPAIWMPVDSAKERVAGRVINAKSNFDGSEILDCARVRQDGRFGGSAITQPECVRRA